MADTTYTIPQPGTVGPNHDEFVDALAEMDYEWEGDDCGLIFWVHGNAWTLLPGDTVTVSPPRGLTIIVGGCDADT